jgi:[ribosomal protein S18]-alanine N-acetyltransferase
VQTELTIRQAASEDKAKLKTIIDLSFPRFFRYFAAHSLDSEEGKTLVAEEQGAVTGFAKLIDFHVAERNYGCILWLAVHPNNRRKGVASTLVEAGVENLKRGGAEAVFASVQRRNKASLATFDKEGFERIGFVGLGRLFGWSVFKFYGDIWYAPGEIVLLHG